jgi:hypothetical protein
MPAPNTRGLGQNRVKTYAKQCAIKKGSPMSDTAKLIYASAARQSPSRTRQKMSLSQTRDPKSAVRGVKLSKPENLRIQMVGCVNGRAVRTRAAVNRVGDLLPIIADIRAGAATSLRAIANRT